LFEAAGDGIMVMDEEARPLEVNARLCSMLGYSREQILQMPVSQGIADLGDNPMQLARLRDQDRYVIERQLRHASGGVVSVEVSVTRLGPGEILAVIRDVTERARALAEETELRRRLAQSERMESLGRLAGGIAHDFNNLLTVIMGNVDLLRREGSGSETLEEIAVASHRAADLTRQLLAFGRRPIVRPQAMDPNECVKEAAGMLRRLLGEDVSLELDLQEDVGRIHGDPGQFTQVILNLAINARDALPDGGRISIQTSTLQQQENPYLRLAVTANGPGIAPQFRERIFEPFFTSKAVGEGTGLGLATVFGIVSQWGGSIEAKDALGGGTTLEVCWPLLADADACVAEVEPPSATRRLRILLVEDDDSVRSVVDRALQDAGHHVTALAGPHEVLARGPHFLEGFELLLTDVVMPEMDGPTLARKVGAKNVVFMSGYPGDALDRRGLFIDPDRFLEKPFTVSALRDMIARVAGPER
jgi:PAS domain S-box-containing protein